MISVIVPVYNAEKYICETIDSVLAQTYTDFELLLVDDCSKDNSVKLIQGYTDSRVKLLKQSSNMGAWAARNRGLLEAKGRYIAFLDADDIWVEDKLSLEMDFMKDNDAGFVFAGYEFADCNGMGTGKVVHVPKTFTYVQALKNTTIFTSTVLIDLEKIPRKLVEMPHVPSEDTATWWAILKRGYVAYGLDKNVVKYRRSDNTLSSNKVEAIKRIWNLYRRVEELPFCYSVLCFFGWAVTAVKRRL